MVSVEPLRGGVRHQVLEHRQAVHGPAVLDSAALGSPQARHAQATVGPTHLDQAHHQARWADHHGTPGRPRDLVDLDDRVRQHLVHHHHGRPSLAAA
jgi:hypothetical protein